MELAIKGSASYPPTRTDCRLTPAYPAHIYLRRRTGACRATRPGGRRQRWERRRTMIQSCLLPTLFPRGPPPSIFRPHLVHLTTACWHPPRTEPDTRMTHHFVWVHRGDRTWERLPFESDLIHSVPLYTMHYTMHSPCVLLVELRIHC